MVARTIAPPSPWTAQVASGARAFGHVGPEYLLHLFDRRIDGFRVVKNLTVRSHCDLLLAVLLTTIHAVFPQTSAARGPKTPRRFCSWRGCSWPSRWRFPEPRRPCRTRASPRSSARFCPLRDGVWPDGRLRMPTRMPTLGNKRAVPGVLWNKEMVLPCWSKKQILLFNALFLKMQN